MMSTIKATAPSPEQLPPPSGEQGVLRIPRTNTDDTITTRPNSTRTQDHELILDPYEGNVAFNRIEEERSSDENGELAQSSKENHTNAELMSRITELERIIKELQLNQQKANHGPTNNLNRENLRTKNRYKQLNFEENKLEHVYPKYFVVELHNKRKMCPFKMESDIVAQLGEEPKAIDASGRDKILIEVKSEQQSKRIVKLKEINKTPCLVEKHKTMNQREGIIYIYEYNVEDLASFENGLKRSYPVSKVIRAFWIKPKDENARAFLVTFEGTELPDTIRIPGERPTRVYKYYSRPMLCRSCLGYGHTAKYCKKNIVVCARCAIIGHTRDNCNKDPRCYKCGGSHQTGHKSCPEQRYQQEIINIQTDFQVDRQTASDRAREICPNRPTYAKAIANNRDSAEAAAEQHNDSSSGLDSSTSNSHIMLNPTHEENVASNNTKRTRENSEQTEHITSNPPISQPFKKQRDDAQNIQDVVCIRPNDAQNIQEVVCIRPNDAQSIHEVVCIRPNTGEQFTTTVNVDRMEDGESDDGTSECNPGLRSEAKKMYKSYKEKIGLSASQPTTSASTRPKHRSRSRSHNRSKYKSRSRSPSNRPSKELN